MPEGPRRGLSRKRQLLGRGEPQDRLPRASTIQHLGRRQAEDLESESGLFRPRIEPATDADVRPAAEVAVRSLRWTKGPRRSTGSYRLGARVALRRMA